MNASTQPETDDLDFVVVDMTDNAPTGGSYDARLSTPDSWLPKAIRANLKRLDAHKKGNNALVPSTSFRFTPSRAWITACAEMDALAERAKLGSDVSFLVRQVAALYNMTPTQFAKKRAQIATLVP